MSEEKPPLGLHAELVYPDSTTVRWDKDAPEAKDRPTGITLRSRRYTGWADSQLALARRGDIDYPDLDLLDGFNLIGHDGSSAYEGRVASIPRSLQTNWSVGVQAQGWMSHSKSQSFVEPYVDRDLSKWVTPSARRIADLVAANYSLGNIALLPDEAGNPVIELAFQGNWASPYRPVAEAWWLPQAGIQIGSLYYDFTAFAPAMNTSDVSWTISAYVSSDDRFTAFDNTGNLWPTPSKGYLAATAARTAAALQLVYQATPAGIAGTTWDARLARLAIYGTHGLTRRGADPGGFYVSDIMANIAQRWAPKLDTSGVTPTTFIVPHSSFLTDIDPYDAWQMLNTYHRWEIDVFEGRRLNYYPIDLTDWDWEVRASDPGTTVLLQGDDLTNLCNGVIVHYRDLDTGYATRLSPAQYPESLRDLSPDNPANRAGEPLYTTLTLSVPTNKEGALQIGRAYLSEFNQAKAPGTITVTGHIRDRQGHWQQGWKVRSSDRLIITDMPNDNVRIVGEAEWNHDTKQLTIAVDSGFKRLDAIMARLGVAVEAANLSLP